MSQKQLPIDSVHCTGSHPDLSSLSKLDEHITQRKRKQPETDCDCKRELINLGKEMRDMFEKNSKSQEAYFSTVREDMAHIKNKIDNIQDTTERLATEQSKMLTEITQLQHKCTVTDEKIKILEQKMSTLNQSVNTNASQSSPEELIGEIADRSERQKNIVITGLTEAEGNNFEERQARERNEVENILKSVLKNDVTPRPWKIIRIGKFKPGTNRPLKVCFDSSLVAKEILRNRANYENEQIKLYSDQTPAQQTYMKNLRQELTNRIENGEPDLTIKYIRGTPRIVTLPKNYSSQSNQ